MKLIKSNCEKEKASIEKDNLSRREFLKVVGIFAFSVSGSGILSCSTGTAISTYPRSKGYILVDSKKCQGCMTCMIACSLVNEGCVNLSLARLQVVQDPLGRYPTDLYNHQCRQCEEPRCVKYCPNDALIVDTEHGNIRLVNKDNCIGCGRCIEACPFEPKKPIIAPDNASGGQCKSRKCDLCLNASYHWDPATGGGVNGLRACETFCPVKAIQFTSTMPAQDGDAEYDVDMRYNSWGILGFTTN